MSVLITELAEHGSLMNFCILFLHRTLRIHEMRTLRSTKQVDHRYITRTPVQLHEIVLVEPYRIGFSRRKVRTKLVGTGSLLGRVWQHDLLDGILESSQHRTEMQSSEDDLDVMQGLVAYDLGSSERRVELGTLLVTLVHVRMEMVDQCLRPNELCNTVRPGLPAFVGIDMRDEEVGNSDAVLDGSEMLAKLRVQELVLEILTLANRKGHPTVEKTDPVPEKRKSLGSEVEVTERGAIAHSGLLDGGGQGQRHVDEVGPETIVGIFWRLWEPKYT